MTDWTIQRLLKEYPFTAGYFEQNKLDVAGYEEQTFKQFLEHFTGEELEDQAIDKEKLLSNLPAFIEQMQSFLELDRDKQVYSLTILPGHDKSGGPEGFSELTVEASQIISILWGRPAPAKAAFWPISSGRHRETLQPDAVFWLTERFPTTSGVFPRIISWWPNYPRT